MLLAVGLMGPRPLRAEPLIELADEGRTLIYTARPGDSPGAVAAAFGLPPEALPGFLAANGIKDDTAVPRGFRYRIPNPVAAEAAALVARQQTLVADSDAAKARVADLERSFTALRENADFTAAQRRRLEQLELRWSVVTWVVTLLIVAVLVAIGFAIAAIRKEQQAERWARAMAQEAEEKRRTGLVERQQAAKHVVELEARVRELEQQVVARVRAIGR
ncbi:MAG TPA: hypothetical protein VGR62_08240 [Candidatus Binatia bacterium]|jgi:hypothetical protein|nr:hypothetical protein [Candidatus Binatia bacterium]